MSEEQIDPQVRAADFRRRVLAGEQITPEEYREAIALIRTIRRQRSDAGKASKAKTGGKVDVDALLNDLI